MARTAGHRHEALWRRVLIGSLIAVLPAISLTAAVALAQSAPATGVPQRPPKINPSLPGVQTGTLTLVKNTTVQINGKTYALAAGALIQDPAGTPMQLPNGRHRLSVRYWLGTGQTQTQITQMIVELLG